MKHKTWLQPWINAIVFTNFYLHNLKNQVASTTILIFPCEIVRKDKIIMESRLEFSRRKHNSFRRTHQIFHFSGGKNITRTDQIFYLVQNFVRTHKIFQETITVVTSRIYQRATFHVQQVANDNRGLAVPNQSKMFWQATRKSPLCFYGTNCQGVRSENAACRKLILNSIFYFKAFKITQI